MDLSEVTEPLDLLGDVSSPMLDFWRVSSRLRGQTDWQELNRGSQPRAGERLATFDPPLLLNGLHEPRLEAVDSLGRIVEDRISVVVDSQIKIGHFTLSFVDLQIPLSGLDIRILRTYDSRDTRLGDFGVGWTLDTRQGFYQNNLPPGDGWQIPATSGPWGLPCSVVQETKSHLTTVRLSDQEVYRPYPKSVTPAFCRLFFRLPVGVFPKIYRHGQNLCWKKGFLLRNIIGTGCRIKSFAIYWARTGWILTSWISV